MNNTITMDLRISLKEAKKNKKKILLNNNGNKLIPYFDDEIKFFKLKENYTCNLLSKHEQIRGLKCNFSKEDYVKGKIFLEKSKYKARYVLLVSNGSGIKIIPTTKIKQVSKKELLENFEVKKNKNTKKYILEKNNTNEINNTSLLSTKIKGIKVRTILLTIFTTAIIIKTLK